ncbi:MAG: alanine--tRNA ligase [Verrucomicrobiae bacterium]|nr:alanine--tRNA ligase [Verrucomicrobiae bacterium]
MTSREIRQSFLDFFRSKQHTIVPSSSLLPDAPNLLFTNAGMNQFVPIFLGQQPCPCSPPRAADTQKCIRAGGKHNDLEDVGLDTYHHTFFEMLGNWSFGNYFKKEAIGWSWELVVGEWKFPKERIYATVYKPEDGDPSVFDQEAYDHWKAIFEHEGLDPDVHIRTGGKKDNFWMMGETGPCGPCSELHVDLTPKGDTEGRLVNEGSPDCIEIWNLVFIQFNAQAGGKFGELPAKHVDTGMGLERVTSIIQCTRGMTDFSLPISNYDTDLFSPVILQLEALSGKKYLGTLPNKTPKNEQERLDIAFRAIADHARTLSFAIADGILPGNEGRAFVLRRILRRAVRHGRVLGLHAPFFHKLAGIVIDEFGSVFPELRQRREKVQQTVLAEEKNFNETLDRGIEIFENAIQKIPEKTGSPRVFPADVAFKLHDTYGFPLDLTQLMARERDVEVDLEGFEKFMTQQREMARAAQKKEVIEVAVQDKNSIQTQFMGYDTLSVETEVLDVLEAGGKKAVILQASPFYAEMGGQAGDQGTLREGGQTWRVIDTRKQGDLHFHLLAEAEAPAKGAKVTATVDASRRAAIQRHHTATHLFHWALHKTVDPESRQRGSFVGPDYLRFDFNLSQALTKPQIEKIESLVNGRIQEKTPVKTSDCSYTDIQRDKSILQFFGDKYADKVRVLQIGDFSKELCGGTHVKNTGDIGLFKIKRETAVAAGIRRIEAVAGPAAQKWMAEHQAQQAAGEEKARLKEQQIEQEKQRKAKRKIELQTMAGELTPANLPQCHGAPLLIRRLDEMDGEDLRTLVECFRQANYPGIAVLGGVKDGRCSFIVMIPPSMAGKLHAGQIVKQVASVTGGAGGGKPDVAQAGGKDPSKIGEALALAEKLICG